MVWRLLLVVFHAAMSFQFNVPLMSKAMSTAAVGNPSIIQQPPILCSQCSMPMPSRNKLFAHIRAVHCDGAGTTSIESSSSISRLEVVYEDDHCKVIVKPQGLATMGLKGLTVHTHPDLLIVGGTRRKALPCHRLDKGTGGLLVCSKSKQGESIIRQCFRFKWVQKKYLAMVLGKMLPLQGELRTPIKGKAALTNYQVTSHTRSIQGDWISTVELFPVTGRKHQLRKQLSQAGHAILGDQRYSHAASWPKEHNAMFLWAVGLSMPHPAHLQDLFDKHGLHGNQVLGPCVADDADYDSDASEESLADDLREDLQAALLQLPRLEVSIPEPAYYQDMRSLREHEWRNSDQRES